MDNNGTRFQLLHGKDDWLACAEAHERGMSPPGLWTNLAWDESDHSLRLRRRPRSLPVRGRQTAGPGLEARRGAALDGYGNLYWIGQNRRSVYRLPSGSRRPQLYWSQTPSQAMPTAGFAPTIASAPLRELAGLTVSEHHYLLLGYPGGVLVFDLHSGGPPAQIPFPAPFQPFAMTAATDGGVWILDRLHRRAWGLDRSLRLSAKATSPSTASAVEFCSATGPTEACAAPSRVPAGLTLEADDPIALAALPDGALLILDTPPGAPPILHCYDRDGLRYTLPLETTQALVQTAHDLAYDPREGRVYVADAAAGRVLAYRWRDGSPPGLEALGGTRPLYAFTGRALVSDRRGGVRYDLGRAASGDEGVRWPTLATLPQEFRYAREAVCLGPILDGRQRDCKWDTLFLDARIPSGTEVRVAVRSHDRAELVASAPFIAQPPLYLRGLGAEVPYYEPYADCDPPPPGTGSYEVLLQEARGRYLQVRLELLGDGSASPRLRTLRVYYPRFSYSERYLPAVYRQDPGSASFLERLLANFQGFHAHIEGRMAAVGLLLDPRSAPAEVLDWLGGWLGLSLDPLWGELHRRADTGAGPGTGEQPDRRRLFIRLAPLLFERRGTAAGIRLALHLLLEPCLEAMLRRFQRARTEPDPGLTAQLARIGLSTPRPDMDDEELEALFFAFLVSPQRPSQIRLMERFLTRTESRSAADTAHRFSVLLPEGMDAERLRMVERIVELEKPAHTAFDLRRYWEGFRVGEARLGQDTLLGDQARFHPVTVGNSALGSGFLAAAPPLPERDRFVLDRNPPGAIPPRAKNEGIS